MSGIVSKFLVKWFGKDYQTNFGAMIWVGLGIYDFCITGGFTPESLLAIGTAWGFWKAKDKD